MNVYKCGYIFLRVKLKPVVTPIIIRRLNSSKGIIIITTIVLDVTIMFIMISVIIIVQNTNNTIK